MREVRNYSELFFSSAFENIKNTEILSTDFVVYLTTRILIKNPNLFNNLDKLFDIVSLYYPDDTMKKTAFYKMIRRYFVRGNVSEKYKQLVLYSENILAMLSRKKIENDQSIRDELFDLLMENNFNDELLVCLMALDANKTGYSIDYYGFLFTKLMQNMDSRVSDVEDKISKIHLIYKDMQMEEFINNISTLTILNYLGCSTADDLNNVDPSAIVKTTFLDYETFIEEIDFLQFDLKNVIHQKTKDAVSKLKERNRDILLYKYGFDDGKEHTLEETGLKYGLTRERVRQIEARSIEILVSFLNVINKNIKYMILKLSEEKGFTTFDKVKSYLDDEKIALFVIICLPHMDGVKLNVDYKSNLIINLGENTLEEIEEAQVLELGNIISVEEANCLNEFQSVLLDKYYNLKRGTYLKKGLNATVILDSIVRDVLPNGYHNGSTVDYQIVLEEGKKRYGDDFDYSSEHAMMAVLERANYILVDRGTYKHKELCSDLTNELLSKILEYVVASLPIVFYSAIFDEFERELKELGINNQYYLKGVLDDKLPDDMHTKRDYITAEKGLTSQAAILNKMNEFTSEFTIDDLRRAFPTTRDYIFNNVFYYHDEFLNLYRGRYINFDLLNLTEDSISQLKSVIDKSLSMSSTSFVTDRKIFARLKLFNKELLSKLTFIENHFALFSLIQYLFKDEYYLRRPFVSSENNEILGAEAIYADYVSTLDEFDSKVITNYGNKLNMRGLYSYLEFMDMMADEYVQVSMDKMVKKKCINLHNDTLQMIESVVETAIKYSGAIDTRTFKGYGMLPKINYPWNKYLLAGIIRTYFDEYSIDNTSNFTHKTDFIIKKIEIEE